MITKEEAQKLSEAFLTPQLKTLIEDQLTETIRCIAGVGENHISLSEHLNIPNTTQLNFTISLLNDWGFTSPNNNDFYW